MRLIYEMESLSSAYVGFTCEGSSPFLYRYLAFVRLPTQEIRQRALHRASYTSPNMGVWPHPVSRSGRPRCCAATAAAEAGRLRQRP